MPKRERLICASTDVQDGARGARFAVAKTFFGDQAFVIRYAGKVHAYRNSCPHALTELDWNPGEFFDDTGLYLVCATHGAHFEPHSGFCTGGPCRGQRLQKLEVVERDGAIYCIEEEES
jgi:nitrite reductase/ring-hydroxylating ferredoxin subunit